MADERVLPGRRRAPGVRFVVMEHPSRLDGARRTRYEEVRARLEAVAGAPVETVHYLDVRSLDDADAVVVSGAGGPWSLHDPADLAALGDVVRTCERPVFGICAGMQLLAEWAGARVEPMAGRGGGPEEGFAPLEVLEPAGLLDGLGPAPVVLHDHRDEVVALPAGFRVLARTDACPVQALEAPERGWWGTQFHPECWNDEHPAGARIVANFFALAGVGR